MMWYAITFVVGALTGFAIVLGICLVWIVGEARYDK